MFKFLSNIIRSDKSHGHSIFFIYILKVAYQLLFFCIIEDNIRDMRFLLKNAWIYQETQSRFAQQDLLIENDIVAAMQPGITAKPDDSVIDLTDCYIFPGLVDVHVHFREPGFSYKETIATGCAAALQGGYTTVCTMPNLQPAPDSLENLAIEEKLIHDTATIHVLPYGCITQDQKGDGKLVDFKTLSNKVVAFSDDGHGVQSEALMRQAMEQVAELDKIIVAHCEINSLIKGGYIHDGKYAQAHGHKGICSESEWQQVERDIQLSRETGCRYHVCHVSTKESVELIRAAKAEGLKITCETAPHYLLLCEEDLQEDGRFKMNPPLRSKVDKEALLQGIIDDTIDIIATDHAPHSYEEKARGLTDSAFGIVGLETAFPLLYTYLVKQNIITLEHLIKLMSVNPRKIFGLKGALEIGEVANFTVFRFQETYKIDSQKFVSKGKSTPFDGWKVEGKCIMTHTLNNAIKLLNS